MSGRTGPVGRAPGNFGAGGRVTVGHDARLTAARAFIAALPYARALRITLDAIGSGSARVSMPYDAALIGDPQTGVIHGGVVSALLDTCAAAAVLCHPDAPAATATLDLRIDYMRSAVPGQRLRASADCHHITRSVAFVRATALDDDDVLPVAVAAAAFTVTYAAGKGVAP